MGLAKLIQNLIQNRLVRTIFLAGAMYIGINSAPAPEAPAYHTTPKRTEEQKEPPAEAIIHPNLTKRIADLHIESYPETQTAKDLKNKKLLDAFIKGSIDEDHPLTNTFEHSYNPGRSAETDSWELFGGLGNKGDKDALARAQELWDESIQLYLQGKKEDAYYTLGKVIHLVPEDMGSPAHVFLIPHFRLQKLVTTNQTIDTESAIYKLIKSVDPKTIDWSKTVTTDIGDDYETTCASIELSDVINRKLTPRKVISLKDAADKMALFILEPQKEIKEIIERHYTIGKTGNGKYASKRASKEDILVIAKAIVPTLIEYGTGLLELWEKSIPNKSSPVEGFLRRFGSLHQILRPYESAIDLYKEHSPNSSSSFYGKTKEKPGLS